MKGRKPIVGLIVNPIAGMGGRVGLKGTDGADTLQKARELGATPVAPGRARKMLAALRNQGLDPTIVTYPHEMGGKEASELGFAPNVLGSINSGETTSADTVRAARDIVEADAELVLFVGGDGTANDVYGAVGTEVPILGVPAGVKVFSGVFANTPEGAAKIVSKFLNEGLPTREAEVMDVDEEAYRANKLKTELKGYALCPYEPDLRQDSKLSSGTWGSEKLEKTAIARCIAEAMNPNRLYILGPGTTTKEIAKVLGIEDSSLLGVDLIKGRELVASDVGEKTILRELESSPGAIVVSPIGRQGFILGRGNQQISPSVIRKVGRDDIIVVATPTKLQSTERLKVDTGDLELDQELRGDIPVIAGYWLKRTMQVV
jgi:predicted polyphosphate/ATP-dependent NAD kinase